eukprot:6213818-Pleurochrysis_carterae.AAC.1
MNPENGTESHLNSSFSSAAAISRPAKFGYSLAELDCGLIVGGRQRTLGALPPDGIEAKGTAKPDLSLPSMNKGRD